jgi:hypothetical protein
LNAIARSILLIYNWPGLAIAALAYGVSFGICRLAGVDHHDGALMAILGPLAVALDVAYRRRWGGGDLLRGGAGGALFFVPVWVFGVVWSIIGAYYLIQPSAAPH